MSESSLLAFGRPLVHAVTADTLVLEDLGDLILEQSQLLGVQLPA